MNPAVIPAEAVFVNGVAVGGAAGLTLAELLDRLGEPAHGVATARNGCFVPVGRRTGTRLGEGDHVTIVSPIVGG